MIKTRTCKLRNDAAPTSSLVFITNSAIGDKIPGDEYRSHATAVGDSSRA